VVWQLDERVKVSSNKREEKKDTRSRTKERKEENVNLLPYALSALQEPFGVPPVIPVDIYSNKKNINSHRNPILSIEWLPIGLEIDWKRKPITLVPKEKTSSEHNQFFTVSMDGQLLFWDLRNIGDRDSRQQVSLLFEIIYAFRE
jgi:hypothetical protein